MNEQKFTGKADVYEKFRPSYPDELIDFLYGNARCDAVADIGAGTGKFTRCLLKKPWSVTAVEPNADMRGKLTDIEGLTVVNAPAENTGLADKSVGLITAAQAFHWFDEEPFRRECMRVLKDGGKLAVVWLNYVKEGMTARKFELCQKYSTDEHYRQTGHAGMRAEEESDAFFAGYFKEYQKTEFFGELVYDRETFIGEALSGSYSPCKYEPNYKPFVEELNALFSEYESRGETAAKTKIVCYFGSF